ncbi:MAG: hypothetical protein F4Y39_00605 [Gemmatimonadetes bacterium]|nr:hypothetical protein [Gemmatimonadota bacterium]
MSEMKKKDESRKQTEIGRIPESWEMVRLGEVATFTKKPRNLIYSKYNEVPFVPMELIPIAKLFSKKFIPKTNDELKSGTYFETGDILLSKITPSFENGKQCIIKELPTPFGIATTEIIPIQAVVDVSDKFYLFYYLLLPNVRAMLAGRMQGTTGRQRLSKEILANLEIPLPPLPEQHAIAHVLQTIQEAKFVRQREIALERERKAALMDYLFSHGTKGEPRRQTEIGEIPESWKVVKLGDKVELKNGINFKKEQKGQGILTVDVLNMYSDGIYLNTDNLYRVDYKIRDRDLLKTKDILFVRSSLKQEGVAWASLFNEHEEPVTFCGFLIRARLTTLEIDPEFLTNYFRTSFARKLLVSKSARLAITNISQATLSSCPIVLPSFFEQREIAEILQVFDKKIATLEQEAAHIDELFHTMIDELMTGQRSAVPLLESGVIQ